MRTDRSCCAVCPIGIVALHLYGIAVVHHALISQQQLLLADFE